MVDAPPQRHLAVGIKVDIKVEDHQPPPKTCRAVAEVSNGFGGETEAALANVDDVGLLLSKVLEGVDVDALIDVGASGDHRAPCVAPSGHGRGAPNPATVGDRDGDHGEGAVISSASSSASSDDEDEDQAPDAKRHRTLHPATASHHGAPPARVTPPAVSHDDADPARPPSLASARTPSAVERETFAFLQDALAGGCGLASV